MWPHPKDLKRDQMAFCVTKLVKIKVIGTPFKPIVGVVHTNTKKIANSYGRNPHGLEMRAFLFGNIKTKIAQKLKIPSLFPLG